MSLLCESLYEYKICKIIEQDSLNEGLLDNKYIEYFKNISKEQVISLLNNPKFRDKRIYLLSMFMAASLGVSKMSIDALFNSKMKSNPVFKELMYDDVNIGTLEKLASMIHLSDVHAGMDIDYRPDIYGEEPNEANTEESVNKGSAKKIKTEPKVNPETGEEYYTLADIKSWDIDSNEDLTPINTKEAAMLRKSLANVKKRGLNSPNNGKVNINKISISNRGLMRLKKKESYESAAYIGTDSKNITVGFGTADPINLSPYKVGDKITLAKGYVYLYGRLRDYERAVEIALQAGAKKNKNIENIPQECVDALISMAYNTGPTGFKTNEVGKALYAGDIKTIVRVWKNTRVNVTTDGETKKSKGLLNRRKKEANTFASRFDHKTGRFKK